MKVNGVKCYRIGHFERIAELKEFMHLLFDLIKTWVITSIKLLMLFCGMFFILFLIGFVVVVILYFLSVLI